jgi:energy-converting hydrogenase A subunit M
VRKETKTIVQNSYTSNNHTFISDNRSYNLTVIHQVDKKFFIDVINRVTNNLAKAISASSEIILEEMRRKEVRGVIREVQAHVTTLQNLTTYNTLDPQIALQLMTNILNPLQVRIEYAS